MREELFAQKAKPDTLPKPPRLKGVIVGAGAVGMTSAYSLVIQNIFNEITLVDRDRKKLEGEVMDLMHGIPLLEPTEIRGGTFAETNNPDIVILTAGSKQKPGESRLDLVHRNVEIFKNIIPEAVKNCPNAIFLVVTNPVDIMTYVTLKLSGLPRNRVLGSGTILDTIRFCSLLAEKMRLSPQSINGYIIGEHGDSEVPVWSKTNISGMPLLNDEPNGNNSAKSKEFQDIFNRVKNAAYEIIDRKGATYYAIGLGVTEIVKAILRDQNRVLTVSSLIDELYDIEDVCLSLPTVLNRGGVDRIINLELTQTEREGLQSSAKVMAETIAQINL